jgi:hypothetical protein
MRPLLIECIFRFVVLDVLRYIIHSVFNVCIEGGPEVIILLNTQGDDNRSSDNME